MTKKKRVLSGMRPTGPLHLGNLLGALANWVEMQATYDCFFFIADWHALTSDYEKPNHIKGFIREMMIDWLSVGLSPDKSTLYVGDYGPVLEGELGHVWVINTAENEVIGEIEGLGDGFPYQIVFTPDGSKAYLAVTKRSG